MADQPDTEMRATTPEPPEPVIDTTAVRRAQRKRWLGILAIVVLVVAVLVLLYHFLIGVRRVSTDNAYVGAETATVTPLIAAPVASVRVQNTQVVHKGDILVTLDPADAQIAADRAKADLAQARRQLQNTTATGGALV